VITMDVILSILRAYVYVRAKNVPKKRKNNKKKKKGGIREQRILHLYKFVTFYLTEIYVLLCYN